MNIHSELAFISPIGNRTVELHLVEISDENGDATTFGIYVIAPDSPGGTLIAMFDPNISLDVAVTFLVMLQNAEIGAASERVTTLIEGMIASTTPNLEIVNK
jgi:hypothetical protein